MWKCAYKWKHKSLVYIFSLVHLLVINLTFKTFNLREQKQCYAVYKKNYIIKENRQNFIKRV